MTYRLKFGKRCSIEIITTFKFTIFSFTPDSGITI